MSHQGQENVAGELWPQEWGLTPPTAILQRTGTSPALSEMGKSWVGACLPSRARTGPFTQVPCFRSIVDSVCQAGDGYFLLPQSECVHTRVYMHLRTRVYAQASLNK